MKLSSALVLGFVLCSISTPVRAEPINQDPRLGRQSDKLNPTVTVQAEQFVDSLSTEDINLLHEELSKDASYRSITPSDYGNYLKIEGFAETLNNLENSFINPHSSYCGEVSAQLAVNAGGGGNFLAGASAAATTCRGTTFYVPKVAGKEGGSEAFPSNQSTPAAQNAKAAAIAKLIKDLGGPAAVCTDCGCAGKSGQECKPTGMKYLSGNSGITPSPGSFSKVPVVDENGNAKVDSAGNSFEHYEYKMDEMYNSTAQDFSKPGNAKKILGIGFLTDCSCLPNQ